MVLWYIPQFKNNDMPGQEACWADLRVTNSGVYEPMVWPCEGGPMLVPTGNGQ